MIVPLGIALIAFLIKWPAFGQPLAGYFGSYQALNAMMAEMMGGGSIQDLFIPRTFHLFNGSPGLHLLYYPFGSLAAFLGDKLLGGGIPWWGRLQAGLFVFAATLLLYPIARRFLAETKARLAVFLFSFFPMVLLSGIVLQNEAAALFFLVFSFWLLGSRRVSLIFLGGLFFSFALTARIHFIVALPAFLLFLNRDRFSWGRSLCFLIGAVVPVFAWTFWIYALELRYPDFVQTSLFSQSGEGRVLILSRFLSADFYKRIFVILGTYWCTPILAPFAVIGLFRFRRVDRALLAWAWGSLSLIVLLPQKVMDHPFYLLVGAPALSMVIVSCLGDLWGRAGNLLKVCFCLAFLALAMRSYLPPAFHLTESERRIRQIGAYVEQIAAPEDRIIAQHGTSPDLLYYCHRKGWGFDLAMDKSGVLSSRQARHQRLLQNGYGDPVFWLEKLRKDGAKFLVISEPSEYYAASKFSGYVNSRYEPVPVPEKSFLMFDLKERRSP